MGRVNSETIKKLTDFINSLPEEAKGKCSLCNETLVHIVKMAEAQTGAGTATVTRALAENINRKALPGDLVSNEALTQRVRYKEGLKCQSDIIENNPEPPPNDGLKNWRENKSDKEVIDHKKKPEPSLQDQTLYGLNKKPKQKEVMPEYVDNSTEAMQFATIAISQLSRIRKEDPKKIEALNRVISWINNKLQE